MIDNKPPETYMHLHLKLKKMQMEEERLATVQRDNRILLEKMAHIMTAKGRMDNRNNYQHRRYVTEYSVFRWVRLCAVSRLIYCLYSHSSVALIIPFRVA